MRGHVGHNMALDQLIEKINLTCKQMIYGSPTPARICKVVSSLNFIWPLERRHEEVMGVAEDKPQGDMGTSFSDDVGSLWSWMRRQYAQYFTTITQVSSLNVFTGSQFRRVYQPTNEVIASAGANWQDWVDERLSMRRFS